MTGSPPAPPPPALPPTALAPTVPSPTALPTSALPSPVAPGRRAFLLGALGTGVAAVAGCGAPAGSGGSGGPAGKGFPVTVSGTPGPATVPRTPKRVVAVGYIRDTDAALALGAPLVGLTRNTSFPSGLAPWQHPSGDPTLLTNTPAGLPYEKIAGLRPDLILATDDYSLAKNYPKLKGIAPTLAYGKALGEDSWQTTTTRTGRALGRSAEAAALVRRTEAAIERARKDHPEFEGRTFTFGPVAAVDQVFTTNSTTDAAVVFLSKLGLVLSPKVRKLPNAGTAGRAVVSGERLDLLDADLVLLTYPDAGLQQRFEASRLFQKLGAVKRGSYLALGVGPAIAMAFPSALSIPYGLRTVVPQLAAALKRS